MGITISFSMKPQRGWLPQNTWNPERMRTFSRELASQMGYHCEMFEDYVIYQFCPEGFLWMAWKKGQIVGECQTNVAGPGFHAAVIHFLDLYAARGKLGLLVEDDTGYSRDRDFARMRREYFYPWFGDLMRQIFEQKDRADRQLVCWPANYYLPEKQQGMVMTHIRQFSMEEIRNIVHSGVSMGFAKDFFIWNEEEKDACYYRNCALVLMNQECYFMPSKRSEEDRVINGKILDLLERALELKEDLPFPKKEYRELCALDGREPKNLERTPDLPRDAQVGCRKGLLFRTIGSLRFAVPGNYLYDGTRQGNSERYYDGKAEGGHDYYICAMNLEHEAEFENQPFEQSRVERVIDFEHGGLRGRVAIYRPRQKDGETSYEVAAQILYKNQMTIVSVRYQNPSEENWAIDLIRRVEVIEEEKPKVRDRK
ncbi:hypothetical protein [Brotaphodocola sp.]|uniref:hypothetical protein n=1 Tax=Brotaphodocola sp. TaxID=3073577 RepID=UPI003D7EC6BA